MSRQNVLEAALARCLRAMEYAEKVGVVDHLDCCDEAFDGFKNGTWWYKAIEQAKRALNQ